MAINKYPYTDFNEYNLDWIILKIKEFESELTDYEALHSITFGGDWDISKSYTQWTIVSDPITHDGYLSLQPVPYNVQITNTDYWLKIADYTTGLAALDARMDIVEAEVAPLENIVYPDQFQGSDSMKLATAINSLPLGGVVLLNRDYTLTENVVITKGSGQGRVVVRSVNGGATIFCDNFEFTSDDSDIGNCGGVLFDGITFRGTGNLIDGYYLIRMYFINCYIEGFSTLAYNSNTAESRYLQSIHFKNCIIRHISDYMIKLPAIQAGYSWLYDLSFIGCLIEWSYAITNAPFWQGFTISNCGIEGFTGNVPLISGVELVNTGAIIDNYTEKNINTFIDFSSFTINNAMELQIERNLFMEDTKTTGQIILLPSYPFTTGTLGIRNNFFTLSNNNIDGCAIRVPDDANTKLQNMDIQGNIGTIIDPNNRILNKKSLSALYDTEIFKTKYVIDQTPATEKTIAIPVAFTALNNSIIRAAATFPFYTENSTYQINIINVDVNDLGNITNDVTVYSKNQGGVIFAASGSYTSGKSYIGTATFKITFA